MKIIKNLTQTNQYDYLHWLNTNYGMNKLPNRFQPPHTTPFISDRYSKKKKLIL
jgi:hypothetical protein